MQSHALYNGCQISRRVVFKTLLIMKFTIILLIVGFVQVGATGFSQTVTLKFNKALLQDVFKEVEKQSGYSFVYGKEQLATTSKVSLDAKNISLENALQLIFKNQPLDYVISGKYISIRQKNISQEVQQQTLPPPFEVSGKIVNDLGDAFEFLSCWPSPKMKYSTTLLVPDIA